jgi:hypothetical protein
MENVFEASEECIISIFMVNMKMKAVSSGPKGRR